MSRLWRVVVSRKTPNGQRNLAIVHDLPITVPSMQSHGPDMAAIREALPHQWRSAFDRETDGDVRRIWRSDTAPHGHIILRFRRQMSASLYLYQFDA